MDTRDDIMRRLRALARLARAMASAMGEEIREGDDPLTPEWAARRFTAAARALREGREDEARAMVRWAYRYWNSCFADRDDIIERWIGWGTTGPRLRARLLMMRERARDMMGRLTEAIAEAQSRGAEMRGVYRRLSHAAKAEHAFWTAAYDLYAGEVEFARQSAARGYAHWRALGGSEDDIVAAFVERGEVQ